MIAKDQFVSSRLLLTSTDSFCSLNHGKNQKVFITLLLNNVCNSLDGEGVQNNFQWLFSASFAALRSSAVGRTFFSTVSTVFNLFLSNLATPNYWKSKIIFYSKQFSTNHGHIVLSSGVLYRGDVLQCFRVRLLNLRQQLRAWFTVGHSTKSIEQMNISS